MDYNPVPIGVFTIITTSAALAGVFLAFSSPKAWNVLLLAVKKIAAWTLRGAEAPFDGTVQLAGVVYPSVDQCSAILGISPPEVLEAASARGEAVWQPPPEPEIAFRHRTLPIGRSSKKLFIREYSDHQEGTYVSRRERLPILGHFPRGPEGDEAMLRLVKSASDKK